MWIGRKIEEILALITSKIGVQILKSLKKDLMILIENSSITREEQFKVKKIVNNSLHNNYKILKNQISEYVDNKEKYYSLVSELEEQERSRKY